MSQSKKLFGVLGALVLVSGMIALSSTGRLSVANIINATSPSVQSRVIMVDSGTLSDTESTSSDTGSTSVLENEGLETHVLMRDFAAPADSGVWVFRASTTDNPIVAAPGDDVMYLINTHYTGNYQNGTQWDGVSVNAILPTEALTFALNDPSTLNVTCWFDNNRNETLPRFPQTADFLHADGINHAMNHGGCHYSPLSNKFYYQGGSMGSSSDVFTQNSDHDVLVGASTDGVVHINQGTLSQRRVAIGPMPVLPSDLHILVTGVKVSQTVLPGSICVDVSASNAAESYNMNVVTFPRETRSPVQTSADSACVQINADTTPTSTPTPTIEPSEL